MSDDLRLIEDYLPIEAISKEASREKSVRKGHISTLHLWWARRPLVACRAAVYGALVPADRWVKDVNVKNGDGKDVSALKNGTKRGLNRRHAKEFVTKLCRYPKTDPTKKEDIKLKNETEAAIIDAQRHILEAHANRLTQELEAAKSSGKPPAWVAEFKFKGDRVTHDDIVAGRAPRPRVLDMFAGGGAIPLEGLRLGCEAYALDLNPVAHIIQLCTLVYPQKYGKPDPSARGMTGPKNANGEPTWGGLAAEVRYWGNWILDHVKAEIGDLYPLIPDPDYKKPSQEDAKAARKKGASGKQLTMVEENDEDDDADDVVADVPSGFLMPVAYLWSRSVRCKKPGCGANVPLLKQTWLSKREGRFIAMRMVPDEGTKAISFEIVSSDTQDSLGFDPEAFSKAGNATCPFCGTVADSDYVKAEGTASRIGELPMAVACVRPERKGKLYLPWNQPTPRDRIREEQEKAMDSAGVELISERLEANPRSFDIQRYGYTTWKSVFTDRQQAMLMTFASSTIAAAKEIRLICDQEPLSRALQTALAMTCSRLVTQHNAFAFIDSSRETIAGPWGDGKFPMSWDFAEANPLSGVTASYATALKLATNVYSQISARGKAADVQRGSATEIPHADQSIDAVVSDPPYYDSVSYSNLADAFYIWLKRSLRSIYGDHFATELTPKKKEAIAASYRHDNDRQAASQAYECLMEASLAEANRVLKPGGTIAIVYAHKTTLGWSTLVDAMRGARFEIREAWPLHTEMKGGRKKVDRAMLASSIFLVARKRGDNAGVGNYEDDVQPDLQQIVRERVETLWDMGIAGADLVIACVGAGLQAFTRYEKVEYANGEEVPAEKFLAEVEGVVLDTMMGKLFGQDSRVSSIDVDSRFYVLWRYVYKAAEIEAGEAIVFVMGLHVELDGQNGLSAGRFALVEKKKNKFRVRDYTERGESEKLGLPEEAEGGRPARNAPLIDVLHRVLWLMDNQPRKLGTFLEEVRPDRERLRLLAQTLAGAALSGKSEEDKAKLVATTPAEQSALGKLLANWRSLIEGRLAAGDETLFKK
jgi:putative DNA methylase